MTGTSIITVYVIETGEIVKTTGIPVGTEDDQCEPGQAWIAGERPAGAGRLDPATLDYLPLMDWNLTIEPNRVSGIPNGTAMSIPGVLDEQSPPDGIVEITVAFPQVIKIRLSHPLYLDLLPVEVPCAPEA